MFIEAFLIDKTGHIISANAKENDFIANAVITFLKSGQSQLVKENIDDALKDVNRIKINIEVVV